MRALVVFLVLAVAVVICMALVALFTGINLGSTVLLIIGLAVFMVGVLFSAIAALGPKARPTPLLTPTIAGTTAVVLASVALIAGTTHLGNAHRSAMRAGEPEKIAAPEPKVATPAPKAAESGPEPMQFPGVTILPAGRLPGGPAMPDATTPPATMTEPQAVESIAAPAPMAPQPDFADTLADIPEPMTPQSNLADAATDGPATDAVPEVLAADPAPAQTTAAAEPSAPPTATPIPIPPIPPPTSSLVLSEQPFDTTNPPSLPSSQTSASPPSATRPPPATPPLPRSRPCGAGGPPCP